MCVSGIPPCLRRTPAGFSIDLLSGRSNFMIPSWEQWRDTASDTGPLSMDDSDGDESSEPYRMVREIVEGRVYRGAQSRLLRGAVADVVVCAYVWASVHTFSPS